MNQTTITLTHKLLHAGASKGVSGFKRAQLASLGIAWPAKKGWLSGLIGTQVSAETYERFVQAGKRTEPPVTAAPSGWQPAATAPKTRVILADSGYPWPQICLWDAEAGKFAVANLNVEGQDEAANQSRNVWWETEYEPVIQRWMDVPKL